MGLLKDDDPFPEEGAGGDEGEEGEGGWDEENGSDVSGDGAAGICTDDASPPPDAAPDTSPPPHAVPAKDVGISTRASLRSHAAEANAVVARAPLPSTGAFKAAAAALRTRVTSAAKLKRRAVTAEEDAVAATVALAAEDAAPFVRAVPAATGTVVPNSVPAETPQEQARSEAASEAAGGVPDDIPPALEVGVESGAEETPAETDAWARALSVCPSVPVSFKRLQQITADSQRRLRSGG